MGFFLEKNGLVFYQFDIFSDYKNIIHGVSTRGNGSSNFPKNSLNMSFNKNDSDENVLQNIASVKKALDLNNLTMIKQNHGVKALIVEKKDKLKRAKSNSHYDALITNEVRASLLISLGDCQGIILFEPQKQVLALIHSGWRGSVSNIIKSTILTMESNFSVQAQDLLAAISPSLGPCCAEFVNYKIELPGDFWLYKDQNDYFDFWAISKEQLIAAGVKNNNIEIASLCTKCNKDLFFSYRGGDLLPRFACIAGIR